MTRQSVSFPTAFSFSRACTAPYVDAAGVTQTAAVDTPRFDHDPTGDHELLGLLVQGPPTIAAPDLLQINPALAEALFLPATAPDRYTVLHSWRDEDAVDRLDAHFTDDPRGCVNGLLRKVGWHKLPMVFAYSPVAWPDSGDPPNDELTFSEDGTAVLYQGQSWTIDAATRITSPGATRTTSGGDTRITESAT